MSSPDPPSPAPPTTAADPAPHPPALNPPGSPAGPTSPADPKPASAHAGLFWLTIGLILATFASLGAMGAAVTAGDDRSLVFADRFVQQPSIASAVGILTTIHRDLYQPLPLLLLMLETRLWTTEPLQSILARIGYDDPAGARAAGTDPARLAALSAGYRLGNIIWHLVCAVALYRLLRRILPYPALAGLACALWAVHPLHADVLCVAANRIPQLSALLLFLATERYIAALQARAAAANPPNPQTGQPGLAVPVLLLLAAQLCKTTPLAAILWPALAFCIAPTALSTAQRTLHALRLAHVPVTVVALFALLASWTTAAAYLVADTSFSTPLERAAFSIVALGQHARLSLLPLGLSPWYPWPLEIDTAALLGSAILLAGLLGLLLAGQRSIAAWGLMAAWALALVPTLPIIAVRNQLTADRYSYLALPFLLAGLLLIGRNLIARHRPAWLSRHGVWGGIAAVALAGATLLLSVQVGHYRDDATQFEAIVAALGEEQPLVRFRAAAFAMGRDQLDLAAAGFADLEQPLERFPDYWAARTHLALRQRDPVTAERMLQRFEQLIPDSFDGHSLRLRLELLRSDLPAALAAARRALARNDDDPRLWRQFALTALRLGHTRDAFAAMRYLARRWPADGLAIGELATWVSQSAHASLREDRPDRAAALLREAEQLDQALLDRRLAAANTPRIQLRLAGTRVELLHLDGPAAALGRTRAHRLAQAESALLDLRQRIPHAGEAAFQLARLARLRNDLPQALKWSTQAIQDLPHALNVPPSASLDPPNAPDLWLLHAVLLAEAGSDDQALAALEQAAAAGADAALVSQLQSAILPSTPAPPD